jgi:integrase
VTAPTRKQAEYLALQDQLVTKKKEAAGPTVGEAVRAYIDSRDAVLSPATIAGYNRICDRNLQEIANIPVVNFNNERYQLYVNRISTITTRRGTPITPKAVRNICGLVTAAVRWANPSVRLTVKLPPLKKHITRMLSPEAVISIVRGDPIELPVLLALWLSLSMSEIRGLTARSVRGGRLYVDGAVVDVDGVPVRKRSNKAYERTRSLPIPDPIMELIRETNAWTAGEGPLVTMSGQAIYKRWVRIQETAGVADPMTFHGLRHLNASVMMTLVPDTVAMERGGWGSRQTLQNVYQHTMESRRTEYDDRIDAFFLDAYNVAKKVAISPNVAKNVAVSDEKI